MSTLFVTDRNQTERAVDAAAGRSVMEIIRDSGFGELQALCGGCCSCATCHVYVDPTFFDLLPLVGDDEYHLLESSGHRLPNSRLSCQIPFADTLDGLKVRIASED